MLIVPIFYEWEIPDLHQNIFIVKTQSLFVNLCLIILPVWKWIFAFTKNRKSWIGTRDGLKSNSMSLKELKSSIPFPSIFHCGLITPTLWFWAKFFRYNFPRYSCILITIIRLHNPTKSSILIENALPKDTGLARS